MSKVKGVSSAVRSLRTFKAALRVEAGDTVRETVEETYSAARANIEALGIGRTPPGKGHKGPRGQLRRQYRKSVTKNGVKGRVGYISAAARKKAFYARFVHDGTAKAPGRPFHDLAVDESEPRFAARARQAMARANRKR